MTLAIELTEQQRQIIEAQPGLPVEVIDPVTNRVYVLLAAETYQRVQGILKTAEGSHEVSATTPSTEAASLQPSSRGRPMRQRLKDLPLPPEVADELQRYCKDLGLIRKASRTWAEEMFKLQYYFGGQYVGYLRTEEGKVIVAAGALDEAFDRQLDALSREERRNVVLDVPPRWKETVSQILTPFSYEG